jgi:hypothetical protein
MQPHCILRAIPLLDDGPLRSSLPAKFRLAALRSSGRATRLARQRSWMPEPIGPVPPRVSRRMAAGLPASSLLVKNRTFPSSME